MAVIISICSQKGGVGKSTLARLVAREYANAGWSVKIADLDVSQGTSFNWQGRRLQSSVQPIIPVERFGSIENAVRSAPQFDLLIIDAPPNSTAGTLRIARAADIVILPTGLSLDDMQPSVLLAHELVKKGVSKAGIAFALCRVGDSHLELIESQNYITDAGYRVLTGSIPEKIAYRRASDEGRSLTETRFPTLNRRADKLAQSIIDLVAKAPEGEGSVMAKVPPPRGKGEPPPPAATIGNLDKGEVSHLNFRVRKAFHKEFSLFAIQHDYKSQTDVLYEAFELLKRKREGTL